MKHTWIIALMSLLMGFGGTLQAQETCGTAPEPRLVEGGSGIVVSNTELNVRSQPTTRSTEVGTFEQATIVTVLAGPVCADNYYWWRVRTRDTTGWVAEGIAGRYWIDPYVDPAGFGQPAPYADGLPPVSVVSSFTPTVARRELLYTAYNEESENIDIRIYDVNAGESRLVLRQGAPFSPSWSPRGDQISFVDEGLLTLLLLETNDTTPVSNTLIDAENNISWSPGYDYFAYTGYDADSANADIYFVDIATGMVFNATPGTPYTRDEAFDWSPDGAWLSYTSSYFDDGITIAEVRVLDVTNGNSYRVGNFNARSRPIFSPDGVRLAFMIYDPEYGDSFTTPSSLVVADILGGGTIARYNGSFDYNPAWSPEGTQVVYANEQGIIIADAQGRGVVRNIPFQGEIYDIAWSPDRTYIAFIAQPIPSADLVSALTPNLYIIEPNSQFPILVDRDLVDLQVLWRPPEQ